LRRCQSVGGRTEPEKSLAKIAKIAKVGRAEFQCRNLNSEFLIPESESLVLLGDLGSLGERHPSSSFFAATPLDTASLNLTLDM
jgi:hypothetical protein